MEKETYDSPEFNNLHDFMEYYGLKFADEDDSDLIMESIREKIESYVRKKNDDDFKKKIWANAANRITRTEKSVEVSDKDFSFMKNIFETMKNTTDFRAYQKAFKTMCSKLHVNPNSTFNGIFFKKSEKTNKNWVHYNASGKSRRIIIPNGSLLMHTAKVPGIKSLNPSFRSKTSGRWLYPEQRVYFTIGKPIKPTKAGLEKTTPYRYTPKETISTAWIDPDVPNYKDGAIFIKTSTPIPVVPLIEKSKKLLGITIDKKYVPKQ